MVSNTLAILALALGAGLAAAAPWPLDRVIGAVRERDPGVRSVEAEGEAGRAEAAQGWAKLLPRVNASVGLTRGDDPAALFSQKLWQGRFTADDFALDRLNDPPPTSALQWGITADQPIWNGGREWLAIGQMGRQRRAAAAMERAGTSDRLLAAVEAWVAAVGAGQELASARTALESAGSLRGAAVERLRMGQVSEVDTLRAAARLAEARGNLLAASSHVEVALARLSRMVGERIEASDLPTGGDTTRVARQEGVTVAASFEPADWAAAAGPETSVPSGLDRPPGARPELLAAREAAASAASESRQAAMALLPSLHSRFAVTQYRPALGGGWESRWMVAVAAEMPLFDGAERWNAWRAARARARTAEADARRLELDLATDLDAARAEAAVAAERAGAARAGRVAADESSRLAGARYRAGLLPLTDVLAADAEATAARAAEIQATSGVTLARYRLLHARGELK
jgi:outer membrane protein